MVSKKEIADVWDKIAKKGQAYRRKTWPMLADFIAASESPILGVGAGNASYLREQDVATDISFEMCKLASKKVKTLCADAVHLPIKSEKFSRLTSVAMMHHLPTREDRKGFLEEVKRVLKPSGEALITTWYRWQKRHMPQALLTKERYIKWNKEQRYYYLFGKKGLRKLASEVFDDFDVSVESDGSNKNLYLHVKK